MSMQKRNHEACDPDYADVADQQAKRQRVVEQDAKEAVCKKIHVIVKNEFQKEISMKEDELQNIDMRLNQALLQMDRLRACIVATYYGQVHRLGSSQQTSSIDAPPPSIHPTLKKYIGKAPRGHCTNVLDSRTVSAINGTQESSHERIGEKINAPETVSRQQKLNSVSTQNTVHSLALETVSHQQITNNVTTHNAAISSSSTSSSSSSLASAPSATQQGPVVFDERHARFKTKRKIIVGNVSKYIPVDHRESNDMSSHKWMVYVRGPKSDPDISGFVKKVWFFLHHSYKPNDLVEVSSPPFHLTRRGWGEFPVRVQLHFVDPRNKKVDIIHHLKLDKTFTGLQTLGAETVVEVETENYDTCSTGLQTTNYSVPAQGRPSKEQLAQSSSISLDNTQQQREYQEPNVKADRTSSAMAVCRENVTNVCDIEIKKEVEDDHLGTHDSANARQDYDGGNGNDEYHMTIAHEQPWSKEEVEDEDNDVDVCAVVSSSKVGGRGISRKYPLVRVINKEVIPSEVAEEILKTPISPSISSPAKSLALSEPFSTSMPAASSSALSEPLSISSSTSSLLAVSETLSISSSESSAALSGPLSTSMPAASSSALSERLSISSSTSSLLAVPETLSITSSESSAALSEPLSTSMPAASSSALSISSTSSLLAVPETLSITSSESSFALSEALSKSSPACEIYPDALSPLTILQPVLSPAVQYSKPKIVKISIPSSANTSLLRTNVSNSLSQSKVLQPLPSLHSLSQGPHRLTVIKDPLINRNVNQSVKSAALINVHPSTKKPIRLVVSSPSLINSCVTVSASSSSVTPTHVSSGTPSNVANCSLTSVTSSDHILTPHYSNINSNNATPTHLAKPKVIRVVSTAPGSQGTILTKAVVKSQVGSLKTPWVKVVHNPAGSSININAVPAKLLETTRVMGSSLLETSSGSILDASQFSRKPAGSILKVCRTQSPASLLPSTIKTVQPKTNPRQVSLLTGMVVGSKDTASSSQVHDNSLNHAPFLSVSTSIPPKHTIIKSSGKTPTHSDQVRLVNVKSFVNRDPIVPETSNHRLVHSVNDQCEDNETQVIEVSGLDSLGDSSHNVFSHLTHKHFSGNENVICSQIGSEYSSSDSCAPICTVVCDNQISKGVASTSSSVSGSYFSSYPEAEREIDLGSTKVILLGNPDVSTLPVSNEIISSHDIANMPPLPTEKMSAVGITKHGKDYRSIHGAKRSAISHEDRLKGQFDILRAFKENPKPYKKKPAKKVVIGMNDMLDGEEELLPQLILDDYPCIRSLVKAAVLIHPLILPGVNKITHPYSAESLDEWSSWTIGKQRASEWHRACFTRKYIQASLGGLSEFKGEKLMTTRHIMDFCRSHGFSPVLLIPPTTRKTRHHHHGLSSPSETYYMTQRRLAQQSFTETVDLHPELLVNGCNNVTCDDGDAVQDLHQDLEVVVDDVSKVQPVLQQKKDEDVDVSGECIPLSDGGSFVFDQLRKRGIILKPQLLEESGVAALTVAEMLYTSMHEFCIDVLRETFAACDNTARELTARDVHHGLTKLPEATFCCNRYLGKSEDTDVQLPVSR